MTTELQVSTVSLHTCKDKPCPDPGSALLSWLLIKSFCLGVHKMEKHFSKDICTLKKATFSKHLVLYQIWQKMEHVLNSPSEDFTYFYEDHLGKTL